VRLCENSGHVKSGLKICIKRALEWAALRFQAEETKGRGLYARSIIVTLRFHTASGESSPIADIDPKQPNVRFGEKQTSAQNSFGFLLTEFLTIFALTDNTRTTTPPPGSVYAQ
jgi:hypothetical protein